MLSCHVLPPFRSPWVKVIAFLELQGWKEALFSNAPQSVAARIVPHSPMLYNKMTVAGLTLLVLRSRLNHQVRWAEASAIVAEVRDLVGTSSIAGPHACQEFVQASRPYQRNLVEVGVDPQGLPVDPGIAQVDSFVGPAAGAACEQC